MRSSRYSKAIKGEYERKKLLHIEKVYREEKKKEEEERKPNTYNTDDGGFLSTFLSFFGSIFH